MIKYTKERVLNRDNKEGILEQRLLFLRGIGIDSSGNLHRVQNNSKIKRILDQELK